MKGLLVLNLMDLKHSTLIGSYEEGGYKDVDIATQFGALKMIWLTRLLDINYHPWKIIPSKLFSPLGGVTFFHSNLKLADSSKNCQKAINFLPRTGKLVGQHKSTKSYNLL